MSLVSSSKSRLSAGERSIYGLDKIRIILARCWEDAEDDEDAAPLIVDIQDICELCVVVLLEWEGIFYPFR